MVLALCLNSLHIVRGAPTQAAGPSVGNASLPKGSALRQHRRRAIRPVPQSKTGIDKVLGFHGSGLQVRSPSVPCAGLVAYIAAGTHLHSNGSISALRRWRSGRIIGPGLCKPPLCSNTWWYRPGLREELLCQVSGCRSQGLASAV